MSEHEAFWSFHVTPVTLALVLLRSEVELGSKCLRPAEIFKGSEGRDESRLEKDAAPDVAEMFCLKMIYITELW